MERDEDLARLEQFVEKLIDRHNQLKDENSEINALLLVTQQQNAELREMIQNLQEDRSVMHNRVTGLIERIDEWEKVLDQEGSGHNSNSAETETKRKSKKSSPLFKMGADQSPESVLR